jgi:hypothetical protein
MRTLRLWIVLYWIALPQPSIGSIVTTAGARLLTIELGILIHGLITSRERRPHVSESKCESRGGCPSPH